MTSKSPITTHVLDTSRGRPAAGVPVTIFRARSVGEEDWERLGQGTTNADGRVTTLLPPDGLRPGTYRLRFALAPYFAGVGVEAFFYPWADIVFRVDDPDQHYHVPLLLNPFGYSTYRGS